MPALRELHLENCLPDVSPTYLPRTVSLPHLHTLTVRNHVNRCYEVLTQLDIPPVAKIKACCWSIRRCSVLECLRILPLLTAHLSRTYPAVFTGKGRGTGGPQALTLSSATRDNGRTLFVLSAWCAFAQLTGANDRYDGPQGDPDVRLECEWDSRSLELERCALLRAYAVVPISQLRALSLQADDGVWSADDWYNTFAGCPKISHVLAYDTVAESLLDALQPSTGTSIDSGHDTEWATNFNNNCTSREGDGKPLFQELVSLTLAKVDFTSVCANVTAWSGLLKAMQWRKAIPLSVTSLDRLELRECTVTEEKVESLRDFASVVVVGPDHRRS
jgi:hypothetical protein